MGVHRSRQVPQLKCLIRPTRRHKSDSATPRERKGIDRVTVSTSVSGEQDTRHSRSEGTDLLKLHATCVLLCRDELDIAGTSDIASKLHQSSHHITRYIFVMVPIIVHPSLSNSCHRSVVKYNMRYCAHIPTCALSH